MSKEDKGIVIPNSALDRIFNLMETASKETKLDKEKKEDKFKEERNLVKKEFARVEKVLEGLDPTSDVYYKTARNLYELKNILEYL